MDHLPGSKHWPPRQANCPVGRSCSIISTLANLFCCPTLPCPGNIFFIFVLWIKKKWWILRSKDSIVEANDGLLKSGQWAVWHLWISVIHYRVILQLARGRWFQWHFKKIGACTFNCFWKLRVPIVGVKCGPVVAVSPTNIWRICDDFSYTTFNSSSISMQDRSKIRMPRRTICVSNMTQFPENYRIF